MTAFNASIGFDRKMYLADVRCSQAYARALSAKGLLSAEEEALLVDGLEAVLREWDSGELAVAPGDEDVHTANERRLTELVGPVAGKLHTGRSRNDQVATDMRYWLRDEAAKPLAHLKQLIGVAAERAEREVDVLMPGYTHLQVCEGRPEAAPARAQPIRWSHLLFSYVASWKADAERLVQLSDRLNVLPLGSGALAGNPFGIDRRELARDLGFSGVTSNSLHGVCDRDFVAEFLFWASLCMTHLSRFAEDLIIYSTAEFGFVTLADAYRSVELLFLKKNADSLELLRGKCGRVFGSMAGFMMTLKGLPSTYNKDMQEDKEPLFDAVDTINGCLQIACGVLDTLTVGTRLRLANRLVTKLAANENRGRRSVLQIHPERMRDSLSCDMLATDLADYLVRKGVRLSCTCAFFLVFPPVEPRIF
ncbi:MAG: L-Aspartase-like protein [Olpidium bornovanus]|uniref:argininosuccinate lyase n=1 Tax=Olpidium bornovanus TaxID=278681 RepID=A0A8H8DG78_9FUNG|nr:MAG: L-Aspartase-like protein [Olpidium bornovanus]